MAARKGAQSGRAAQERKLTAWLEKWVVSLDEEDRPDRVIVRHVIAGNKQGDEICSFRVPRPPTPDDWVGDTSREIDGALFEESGNFSQPQKYAVLAWSDTEGKGLSRIVVMYEGRSGETGVESEGSDKAGLTSQAMRHTEAAFRLLTTGSAGILSKSQAMLDRIAEMNVQLMESAAADRELINKLLSDKREHMLELEDRELRNQAVKQGMQAVGIVAPVVVNKLAGKKLLPEPEAGTKMLGQNLARSLTPDQYEAISKTLTPEQTVGFMNLMEAYQPAEGQDSEAEDPERDEDDAAVADLLDD